MSTKSHRHWGRIIRTYDGTYIYDVKAAREQVILSPQVVEALHDDGAKAIDKLCALGKSTGDLDWKNPRNQPTLPLLRSLLDYTVFPCSLPELGNPLVVRGCIKLLKSITRLGAPSPFSYEYGQLCFRILLVAYDYCVLKLSDRHDSWMAEASKPKNRLLNGGLAAMLAKSVSELIDERMVEGDNGLYSEFTRSIPWTDSYKGPLINPHDIRLLAEILDSDRTRFLLFVRSNYELRLSALLYTTFQVIHRTPSTPENQPFVQAFSRVYQRYLFLAPGYPSSWGWQHDYIIKLLKEHASKEQEPDTDDSKLVLHAYLNRLHILSDSSPLHPRIRPPLAVQLLEYIVTIVGDGCESLIPPVIHAVLVCVWEDIGYDSDEDMSPEATDACIRLFECLKRLFEFLVQRIEVTRDTIIPAAVKAIFDQDIIDLFVRLQSTVSETMEEAFDNDGPVAPIWHSLGGLFVSLHGNVSIPHVEKLMGESALRMLIRNMALS